MNDFSNHNWDNCRSFWRWDPCVCGWRFFVNCSSHFDNCNRDDNVDDDDDDDDDDFSFDERHTHEFTGSTFIVGTGNNAHNHRFAGVTSPAIRRGNSHVHRVETLTDSTDHFHEIEEFTGEAIDVGGGKHVHLLRTRTSFKDGHLHRLIFATLIENPIS